MHNFFVRHLLYSGLRGVGRHGEPGKTKAQRTIAMRVQAAEVRRLSALRKSAGVGFWRYWWKSGVAKGFRLGLERAGYPPELYNGKLY